FAAAQESKLCCHWARCSAARPASSRVCAITSSSTTNDFSGSKPSTFLVPATSSAPSALPCTFSVPFCVGAGQPMIVLSTISVGLSVSALPSAIASNSSCTSSTYSPVLRQSTSRTCQP